MKTMIRSLIALAVMSIAFAMPAQAFQVGSKVVTGSSHTTVNSVATVSGYTKTTSHANVNVKFEGIDAYDFGCGSSQCGDAAGNAGNWKATGTYTKDVVDTNNLNQTITTTGTVDSTFCDVSNDFAGVTIGGTSSTSKANTHQVVADSSVRTIVGIEGVSLKLYDNNQFAGTASEMTEYNQTITQSGGSVTDSFVTTTGNGMYIQ